MADKPRKQNMMPPKKPAGRKPAESSSSDAMMSTALSDMTKTLRDMRDMQGAEWEERKESDKRARAIAVAEEVGQLHMIKVMEGVKKSVEKNTDRIAEEFARDRKDRKTIEQILQGVSEGVETSEEKKEDDEKEGKRWKEFAESIKKGFKVGVDGGKTWLKGLWDMIKKFKTILLVLGLGTILANINLGDLKKTWLKVKKFFLAAKGFFTPIAEWGEKNFYPATMTLFFETMDDLTKLFDNLTKDFKGFMDKSWIGKKDAIILALFDIGNFVGSFIGNVLNWTGGLLGYDGLITKDIKSWMETHFGPEMTNSITTLFTTVLGGMAIMRVLGMSPLKFMKSMGFYLLTGILRLFAVLRLALSPVGLGITAASLALIYNKEINDAIHKSLANVSNWFMNLPAIVNNALVGTAVGKLFGLKKMDMWDYDAEGKQQDYDEQREKREAAKVKIAGLEEWKRLSAQQSTWADAHEMGKQLGLGWRLFEESDEQKLNQAKIDMLKWDSIAKAYEEHYSDELSTKDFALVGDGPFPKRRELKMIDQPRVKVSPYVTPLKPTMIEEFIDGQKKQMMKLLGKDTLGHEGFESKAYPDAGGQSIGYGFHLSKDGAGDLLKKAGITKSLADLKAGKAELTTAEAKRLVDVERGFFTDAAKNWIGKDHWSKLNFGQKQALYDMSYNMGAGFYKQGNWPALKEAIIANNDAAIRKEIMTNAAGDGPSKYSLDVGRSRVEANIMALQRDNYDLSPPTGPAVRSPLGGAVIDQSTNNVTTNESVFTPTGGSKPSNGEVSKMFMS